MFQADLLHDLVMHEPFHGLTRQQVDPGFEQS